MIDFLNMAFDDRIHEFMRFVTIPQVKHRFNCQFFFTTALPGFSINLAKAFEDIKKMDDLDDLILDKRESQDYHWLNPYEVLAMYYNNEVGLANPQFMITNILTNFKKVNDLYVYLLGTEQEHSKKPLHDHRFFNSPFTFPTMLGIDDTTNKEKLAEGFKRTIHYPGDYEYPLEKLLKLEEDGKWEEEFGGLYRSLQTKPENRARIYLEDTNDPSKMFKGRFEVDFENSPIDYPLRYLKSSD